MPPKAPNLIIANKIAAISVGQRARQTVSVLIEFRLCKPPVVFFTEATVYSCSLVSSQSILKVVVKSCKTNSPIAVAKAFRTDLLFIIFYYIYIYTIINI